jgi:hypothetical protein
MKILEDEDENDEETQNEPDIEDVDYNSSLASTKLPTLDEYLIEAKPEYPEGQLQQIKSEGVLVVDKRSGNE